MPHLSRFSLRALLFCFASTALSAAVDVENLAKECLKGQQKSCNRLVTVATTDADWRTRMAAVYKVQDQSVVANIAKGDADDGVRMAAVERLEDQAKLAEIVKGDSSYRVRREAVRRLSDQKLCAEVAATDDEAIVRRAAFERLTDQALLTTLARTSLKADVFETAISRLTAPGSIAAVASTAADPSARATAAARLMEMRRSECRGASEGLQGVLSGGTLHVSPEFFFSHDPNANERGEVQRAIEQTSERLVHYFQKASGKDSSVRSNLGVLGFGTATSAVYRVVGERWTGAKWQGVVSLSVGENCVWSDSIEYTRAPFVSVIQGDDSHKNPSNAPFGLAIDPWLGKAVTRFVEEVGGQPALAALAQSQDDGWSADDISLNALARLTDQTLLAKVATSAANSGVASAAVSELKDQILLAGIAKTGSSGALRKSAVIKLFDATLLAELATTDKDAEVRRAAQMRLDELARTR
jgi:hypothetical protein